MATEVQAERDANAEECPDPATFSARARHGAAEQDGRTVRVHFSRSNAQYVATITTSDGLARILVDPSCDALAEAAAVIVQLALEGPREPQKAPAPAATTEAKTDPPKDAVIEPSTASPLAFEAMAGAAFGLGLGSPSAVGARIGGALVIGDHWTVGLTGLWLAPEMQSLTNGSVDIGVLGGGLDGCGRLTLGRFRPGLCARAEAFRLEGSARGFSQNESHSRPLYTASVLARGDVRIAGPLGLFAEAGAVVPLGKERFEIQGVGLVYDQPAVAAAGTLGARMRFE